MSAIALMNGECTWLTSLFIADFESLSNGGESDCIFVGVPIEPALFESPEYLTLERYKRVEHRAHNSGAKGNFSIEVDLKPSGKLAIVLENSGAGMWTIRDGNNSEFTGKCELAKKK
jgi:hypothetical protein